MSKDQTKSNDAQVFETLVQQSYSPTSEGLENPSEAVQYKTSLELQYSFRESCAPSLAEISQVMMDLKFQGVPKDKAFYWMLYERQVEQQ